MNLYTNYDFYVESGGVMPEFDFNKLALKAGAFLEKITFDRVKTYEETDAHELQYTVCEIVDAMKLANDAKSGGKQVTSVSNDGYSETYADVSRASETEELYEIATLYLPAYLFDQCIYED